MFPSLLAAGLNLLTLAAPAQHPAPAAEPEAVVLPKEEAKGRPVRAHAAPAVPVEEPAVAAARGKPVHAHAAPAEAEPEAAAAAPRRPAAAARRVPAAPAEAQAIPASDRQLARLQAENARLRAQLAQAGHPGARDIASPDAALAELEAGNRRFIEGARVRTLLSEQDLALRETLARDQAPFAVIITCSDSRLADNLIFDQELGRLFTIREAGNSPDIQGLASVEYALQNLGAKLVVVMGHDHCGAVQAVLEARGKPLPGNLWSLQAAMTGLLESTPEDPNESAASYLDRLVLRNAQRQAAAVVDRSELVKGLVLKGKVKVVPAVYDLASGRVTFLPVIAPAAPAHP